MIVPFTFDEFQEMLARFNTDWWPGQLFMYALAVVWDIGLIAAGIVTGLLIVNRDRNSLRAKENISEPF